MSDYMETNSAPFYSSHDIDQIVTALSAAQGQYPRMETDKKAGYMTQKSGWKEYKYASLQNVLDSVRKPLSENGLAFVQLPKVENGSVVIVSALLHSSGQWIASAYPVFGHSGDPQSAGSALTYARRYGAYATLGIHPDDSDDDGQAAKTTNQQPQTRTSGKQAAAQGQQSPLDMLKSDLKQGGRDVFSIRTRWDKAKGKIADNEWKNGDTLIQEAFRAEGVDPDTGEVLDPHVGGVVGAHASTETQVIGPLKIGDRVPADYWKLSKNEKDRILPPRSRLSRGESGWEVVAV